MYFMLKVLRKIIPFLFVTTTVGWLVSQFSDIQQYIEAAYSKYEKVGIVAAISEMNLLEFLYYSFCFAISFFILCYLFYQFFELSKKFERWRKKYPNYLSGYDAGDGVISPWLESNRATLSLVSVGIASFALFLTILRWDAALERMEEQEVESQKILASLDQIATINALEWEFRSESISNDLKVDWVLEAASNVLSGNMSQLSKRNAFAYIHSNGGNYPSNFGVTRFNVNNENFEKGEFIDASFRRSEWDVFNFLDFDFENVSFWVSNFKHGIFNNTVMHEPKFLDSEIASSAIIGSKIGGAKFDNVDLLDVTFSDVDMFDLQVDNYKWENVTLSEVDIDSFVLRVGQFEKVDFFDGYLKNVKGEGYFSSVHFSNEKLSSIELEKSFLEGVEFSCDFRCANDWFRKRDVDMENVKISNSGVTGLKFDLALVADIEFQYLGIGHFVTGKCKNDIREENLALIYMVNYTQGMSIKDAEIDCAFFGKRKDIVSDKNTEIRKGGSYEIEGFLISESSVNNTRFFDLLFKDGRFEDVRLRNFEMSEVELDSVDFNKMNFDEGRLVNSKFKRVAGRADFTNVDFINIVLESSDISDMWFDPRGEYSDIVFQGSFPRILPVQKFNVSDEEYIDTLQRIGETGQGFPAISAFRMFEEACLAYDGPVYFGDRTLSNEEGLELGKRRFFRKLELFRKADVVTGFSEQWLDRLEAAVNEITLCDGDAL